MLNDFVNNKIYNQPSVDFSVFLSSSSSDDALVSESVDANSISDEKHDDVSESLSSLACALKLLISCLFFQP